MQAGNGLDWQQQSSNARSSPTTNAVLAPLRFAAQSLQRSSLGIYGVAPAALCFDVALTTKAMGKAMICLYVQRVV
jgi:hypothetical protein